MDCETFDRDVVDLLYGDGEAEARDALAQHAETCTRCARSLATLRSGRALAARLPREAAPEGLSRRVLAAAEPREGPALSRRVARAASWAGSLAMRPQFAMAALFCLAVGSSLLLLRARTDSLPGPTSVRESGLPAPEQAPEAAPAPKSPRRADGDDRPAEAPAAAAAPEPAATAEPAPRIAASAGGEPVGAPSDGGAKDEGASLAAQAALDAALARLAGGGCSAALADLRSVAGAFPGTPQAARAGREADDCASPIAARPHAAPPPATAAPAGAGGPKPPPAKSSAGAPAGSAPP